MPKNRDYDERTKDITRNTSPFSHSKRLSSITSPEERDCTSHLQFDGACDNFPPRHHHRGNAPQDKTSHSSSVEERGKRHIGRRVALARYWIGYEGIGDVVLDICITRWDGSAARWGRDPHYLTLVHLLFVPIDIFSKRWTCGL
jgi:hypothetical protein